MAVIAPQATFVGSTDVELVARVRAGDDGAFEELFRRHHGPVAAFVQGMLRDPARAEDITQEAFLSALRRMRVTEARIVFRPWIHEIAKNAAIDHLRRAGRVEEVSMEPDGGLRPGDYACLAGTGPGPDTVLLHKERFDQLRGAFAELSDNHHRILVMRELEGLSYREIGERLGLTRAGVESTLFRARRRLEDEFAALDTGARCRAVEAAIARLASGGRSVRDRRRLDRHAHRCFSCRRRAREHGLELGRSRASRVAALFPAPLSLLRRRRGDDGGGVAHSSSPAAQHAAGTWGPVLAAPGADGAGSLIAKAAALLVAGAVIAGGGTAARDQLVDRDGSPERGSSAPARAEPAERGAAPVPTSPRAGERRNPTGGGTTDPAPGGRREGDSRADGPRGGVGATVPGEGGSSHGGPDRGGDSGVGLPEAPSVPSAELPSVEAPDTGVTPRPGPPQLTTPPAPSVGTPPPPSVAAPDTTVEAPLTSAPNAPDPGAAPLSTEVPLP
jgi:RNA polymerase sigma factor (sigma-70 family)